MIDGKAQSPAQSPRFFPIWDIKSGSKTIHFGGLFLYKPSSYGGLCPFMEPLLGRPAMRGSLPGPPRAPEGPRGLPARNARGLMDPWGVRRSFIGVLMDVDGLLWMLMDFHGFFFFYGCEWICFMDFW